ncbi:unnamed protein product, partial [Ectocarpus sp. 8 AP-2014]
GKCFRSPPLALNINTTISFITCRVIQDIQLQHRFDMGSHWLGKKNATCLGYAEPASPPILTPPLVAYHTPSFVQTVAVARADTTLRSSFLPAVHAAKRDNRTPPP